MENKDTELNRVPQSKGGTGVMSALLFAVIVTIAMIILAHFKGS